ncbi:MAG: 50S ribosomal protein L1 [Rickettsiales bacterium]|nr:50S ribosomal protein L1 [Rickettsiales bacterium]
MVKNTKTKKTGKKSEPEKHFAANLEEAVKKAQELSAENKRKFNESVDIAVNLGIDAKQSDQSVKGSILLPNGSGKKIRVIVFAANDNQRKDALEAGATMVGLEDLVAKIEGGFLDFDCCVATPDVMQKISKVAKKLGPRGLMPSPKNGTVTVDVKKAVTEALKGKADFKNDKAGTVHCLVGKVDFKVEALVENTKAIIKAIKDAKPENSKGKFIKEFYLSTTMGPSVQVATDGL